MERSELDVIHATLLRSAPIARYPDLVATVRRGTAEHHQKLLEIVSRRCHAEKTLLRAALLAGHHSQRQLRQVSCPFASLRKPASARSQA